MPGGKELVAQTVFIAQLQACKGKCQCNVCKLLRKSADAMAEEVMSSNPEAQVVTPELLKAIQDKGYSISPPEDRG